jgi:hypothetical protein
MRHRSARIRLERDARGEPLHAEVFKHLDEMTLARMREGMEEAMLAFEHRPRADKPGVRHSRRAIPGLRSPAGCMRLVHAPSAKYSMMPDDMLAAIPIASTSCRESSLSAAPTPAAAPIAPNTAVGWNPA